MSVGKSLRSWRLAVLLVGGAVASLGSGCKREVQTTPSEPAPVASSAASLPVDHLLPGELAEGAARAYGLVLPRGFVVTQRFEGSIFAHGSADTEATTAFVRRRITSSTEELGPGRTTFQNAKIKGASDAPFVRIDISAENPGTLIVVRDLSPVQVEQGLSQEERWRRAGLKPNGELLDPKRSF